MRNRIIAMAAIVSLGAVAARADVPYPTVDFQGDWIVAAPNGESFEAAMRYRADARKLRIEMAQQGIAMTGLQDMNARELVFWSDQLPMAMRVNAGADLDSVNPERTEETRTVEGESCTVWTVPEVDVCLTDENIPIQTSGDGFTATLANLQRTPQDAALFEVPADMQVMDMPTDAPQGEDMLPGGLGLPF